MPVTEDQYAVRIDAISTTPPDLPSPGGLDGLLNERKKHRDYLFKFCCYLTIASFYLLAGVVIVQMLQRSYGNYSFEVLNSTTFNTLAVSVFGQIIGVIYIIAKSLWSGKEFDIFMNKSKND